MLLRVKVVTSDFKKFYVTISCHVIWERLYQRAIATVYTLGVDTRHLYLYSDAVIGGITTVEVVL